MDAELYSTGFQQRVDREINKIPEYDPKKREHYWIMPLTYHINDPALWYDPGHPEASRLLDLENLVLVSQIGCWHCECLYTPSLAARPCTGEPAQW